VKAFFLFILPVFISSCSGSRENFEILDMKVEENTKNVLSCRLSFKTDQPVETVVRYFSDSHSGYEIRGLKTTDHYFFIWGMRAQSKYDIQIFSASDLENPINTAVFTTGSLPESALQIT